jgi:glycosyltransferase involved in cell wall biosynthesis
MATYNGALFLRTQLDSLLRQTYPYLEIIVVDDGSTDDTLSILREYASAHPHIHIYPNDRNLGYVRNFEKGCGLAKGEFLALCDQDDSWKEDKIEKLVAAIGDAAMVHCDSFLCDNNLQTDGARISDRAVFKAIGNCLEQAVFCRIYGHTTLITKELYRKSVPFLTVIPHDWWLCFMATLHGGIRYVDEPMVHYRQHAHNLFGVVGTRRKKTAEEKKKIEERKKREVEEIRTRINAFRDQCPAQRTGEKKVLSALAQSYRSFSLTNNFRRMLLFFRHYPLLLAVKKRSGLRKILFCFKMFVKIK